MLKRHLALPVPRARRSYTSTSLGFTLVEMMVTLAILVIALSVAVPAMSDWISKNQLRAASHSLESALRAAQSHAQSQSRVVALILTNTAMTDDGLKANQITDHLTHWATYATPINGSSDTARLLEAGALHSDGKITATLTGGEAICFNSLGRLSRQTISEPLELDCASSPSVTVQHSSLTGSPSTLTVSAGGKTELTHATH